MVPILSVVSAWTTDAASATAARRERLSAGPHVASSYDRLNSNRRLGYLPKGLLETTGETDRPYGRAETPPALREDVRETQRGVVHVDIERVCQDLHEFLAFLPGSSTLRANVTYGPAALPLDSSTPRSKCGRARAGDPPIASGQIRL